MRNNWEKGTISAKLKPYAYTAAYRAKHNLF